jgi:hypothetical protein
MGGSDTFKIRNGSENVAAMEATVATDWFQHQKGHKPSFEQSSRPGAIGFVTGAARAMEFLKETRP